MIGKKLKELLYESGKRQVDLARHLGISPSRLSNYLSDKREPDFEMLTEMAYFLGVDLNYFSSKNFKKKGITTTTIPVSGLFLLGTKNPEENVTVFEVNSEVPTFIAKDNDYFICVTCAATPLNDGDMIFENGRNMKFYRFYRDKEFVLLVNMENGKDHVRVTSMSELQGFHKVLWLMKKY